MIAEVVKIEIETGIGIGTEAVTTGTEIEAVTRKIVIGTEAVEKTRMMTGIEKKDVSKIEMMTEIGIVKGAKISIRIRGIKAENVTERTLITKKRKCIQPCNFQ